MSIPTTEQVRDALATVNDPEIKRPITDLGMVDSVEVSETGLVSVHVLLTVSGCLDTVGVQVGDGHGGRRLGWLVPPLAGQVKKRARNPFVSCLTLLR